MTDLKTALTVVRSLALIGTALVFTLGTWSLVITQTIDNRGASILSNFQSRLGPESASLLSRFITAAIGNTARTWTLVITSSITALTILLVIMSNRYYWLRIPPSMVLLMELTSAILAIITFGCAIAIALKLEAFSTPLFPILDSADLSFFALLAPLSRGLGITSALTGFLLITTFTASLVALHNRHVESRDTRAFEPTASALGMSDGFHALHPQPRIAREPIPTIYDPYRAFQKGPGPLHLQNAKHVKFANEGAWMSQKHSNSRWSASTSSPRRIEGEIMRLLDVKKVRRAVSVRPVRPWIERGGAHAV